MEGRRIEVERTELRDQLRRTEQQKVVMNAGNPGGAAVLEGGGHLAVCSVRLTVLHAVTPRVSDSHLEIGSWGSGRSKPATQHGVSSQGLGRECHCPGAKSGGQSEPKTGSCETQGLRCRERQGGAPASGWAERGPGRAS